MSDPSLQTSPSKPRPRLAYLFARYPIVSQTFCDNEILALEKAGWDIVICSQYPPPHHFRHARLDHLRAPVLYAPPPQVVKVLKKWAQEENTWPGELVQKHLDAFGPESHPDYRGRDVLYFAKQLKFLGVDHVHIHFANTATHAAVFLKELSGITFSFTPQGQDFLIDLGSDELLAEMCKEAAFVVSPCDYASRHLAQFCPDADTKLVRIYNGIDPSAYFRAQPKPSPARLRIASVGRLIEFKGFHHLLKAMAKARDHGVTVELELLGDGPWRDQLTSLARELGIENQTNFRGTVGVDGMRECFRNMDAFVLACIVDSKGAMDMFPTVITEAMLSGLPVISSRLAGVPEQVQEGVTGILTEPGDEDALMQALVRLASEPRLAANMGEAGLKRARQMFAADETLPLLEERFEALPMKRAKKQDFKMMAFYDLAQPGSIEALIAEKKTLDAAGVQLWLSGGTLSVNQLDPLKGYVDGAFWMPDGMVLEMEWQSRASHRDMLESLRAEISTGVDGELFLESARRAVWLAAQISKYGNVDLLYAHGTKESLVAWLVYRLTNIPFVVKFDRKTIDKKLRTALEADAKAFQHQQKEKKSGNACAKRKGWFSRFRKKPAAVEVATVEGTDSNFKDWLGGIISGESTRQKD